MKKDRNEGKTVLLGAWVTPAMAAALKAEARRLDVPKSEVIRLALAWWLHGQEQPEQEREQGQ